MLLGIKALLFEVSMKRIKTPLSEIDILNLHIGDEVLLNGVIFTARDAAHQRIINILDKGEKPPFDLKSTIYYVGPAPAQPEQIIGSAGPTTSSRMDPYALRLFQEGAKVTIGKGPRSEAFKKALVQNKGIYFTAIGGIGALLSQRVKSMTLIAFPELGPEAIYRLEVEDFPVIVSYDSKGNDLFKDGINTYKK
jgi:fumarate hydratase subunit beta